MRLGEPPHSVIFRVNYRLIVLQLLCSHPLTLNITHSMLARIPARRDFEFCSVLVLHQTRIKSWNKVEFRHFNILQNFNVIVDGIGYLYGQPRRPCIALVTIVVQFSPWSLGPKLLLQSNPISYSFNWSSVPDIRVLYLKLDNVINAINLISMTNRWMMNELMTVVS